jgi:MFS family permease
MTPRARQFVLAATVLASAMAFIDGTIVMIALPIIQMDFHADFPAMQWVVNAYTLTLGALILVAGALGDRVGRRRVFVIGIAIFALASLACAFAPDVGILIGARAVQGIGGALLVPQSLAIIAATFPREVRGSAIGFWAAAAAITTSLGPPVGGFLIDAASWRAAFLINLPLSAAALWMTLAYVEESRDDSAAGRLDWAGSAAAACSLGALTFVLTLLSSAGTNVALVGAMLIAALAGGFIFWRIEKRARNPILPAILFRSRSFLVANILTLFL